MNGSVWGADPDALDDLGRELERAGRQLRQVQTGLGTRLVGVPWLGHGADRFRQDWHSRYARNLSEAAAAIEALAVTAHRNADEQRDASSAVGGTATGRFTPPATGSGGSPGGSSGGSSGGGSWGGGSWPDLSHEGSASGGGSAGVVTWDGEVSGRTFTGSTTHGTHFGTPTYDPTTGTWSDFVVGASAGAQYHVIGGQGHAGADLGGVGRVDANASAMIGAEARADATASLGLGGLAAHTGAKVLLGARADAGISGSAGGATARAGVHGTAGIEASVDADVELSMDKIEIGFSGGIALGLGGGFDASIKVDPREAASKLGKFTHLW